MKRRRLYCALFVMAMATIASIVAVSCKKEKQEPSSNNTEQALQSADNMDEYLISFKKKLLSAEKGGETIPLEQAQRDLGNLLNFDFGDAYHASNMFQRDTLHLTLSTTNGECDMAQLSAVYREAVDEIQGVYSKVNLPEKSVYYITCSLMKESKDETADIQLVVTTRGIDPSILITTFDETDNWRLDSLRGKCDGTCVGNDHMTRLTQAYYITRVSHGCANGRLYYTDLINDYFYASSFPQTDPAGPYYNWGFRLWCGGPAGVHNYCVGYEEMRYYLVNLHDILDHWMFLEYEEDVLTIDLSITDAYDPGGVYGDMLSLRCDFEYGTRHCTQEPPEQ